MHKQDKKDIWDALNPLVAERAEKEAIKVTWTKGHATEEDITKGRSSHQEKVRNIDADKVATEGITMNEVDAVMVKAARQRKTIIALQQTKLVKIWLKRPGLAAMDQAEQQQLDEEEAAIAEMQEAFKEKEGQPKQPPEMEAKEESIDKEGRRPWQYVKIKVPAYKWDLEEGEGCTTIKPDTMPASIKEEQQSWWYDKPSGGNNRIRLDFPLHLWGEVGNCGAGSNGGSEMQGC